MLNTQRGKTMYKLDVERDVDPDGSGGYILNQELRYAFKNDVIECDCKQCQTELAEAKQAG